MAVIRIDDLQDSRLNVYRDLPGSNLTRDSGRFIAESQLLVERLLASSFRTESILCSDATCDKFVSLVDAALPIYVVRRNQLSEIVGFKFHRGMLACGLRPLNPDLQALIPNSDSGRSTIVVCPQLADPTNLAGVVRNCAAFGVDGLLLGPRCADVYSRRVVRVSMGTVFRLPVRVSPDLQQDLEELRNRYSYVHYATVLDESDPISAFKSRPARMSLLFGSEDCGLDEVWTRLSERRVTLPMRNETDSLNVATSTGIFLYHFTALMD